MAKQSRDYARERRMKGLCCSCSNQALSGKARCQTCTDKNKQRYREDCGGAVSVTTRNGADHQRYKEDTAQGICPACRKQPRCLESVYCRRCLNRQRRRQKVAAELVAIAKAGSLESLQQARAAAGECLKCGASDLFTDALCRRCEALRLQHDEGLSRHEARGRVALCRNCDTVTDGVRCDKHQAERRQKRAERKALHLCVRCKRPVSRGIHCDKCLAKARAVRAKNKADGVCPDCRKPSAGKPGTCCVSCARQHQEKDRRKYAKLRAEVLLAYGSKCACPGCTETNPAFLEVDHINNDGAAHRRSMSSTGKQCGGGSNRFYTWLRQNGFPKDNFQLLCSNCNAGKAKFGICPHLITPPEVEAVTEVAKTLT